MGSFVGEGVGSFVGSLVGSFVGSGVGGKTVLPFDLHTESSHVAFGTKNLPNPVQFKIVMSPEKHVAALV